MKFSEIANIVDGLPYTQKERGKQLYDHIVQNRPQNCLELGFAHGVASCYIAAALDELGDGSLTSVDLLSSQDLEPNIESLLDVAGLEKYVNIYREKNSYTWFLKKNIEKLTTSYTCEPSYDLCFIDGPKNWTIDGFAFFLVDKLLRDYGFIVFDDYKWTYAKYSKNNLDGVTIREMSDDQIRQPNIELVFQLLVMQHPNYSNFVVDEDWAWAQKIRSDQKYLKIVASQSWKYRVLKKLRKLR